MKVLEIKFYDRAAMYYTPFPNILTGILTLKGSLTCFNETNTMSMLLDNR